MYSYVSIAYSACKFTIIFSYSNIRPKNCANF